MADFKRNDELMLIAFYAILLFWMLLDVILSLQKTQFAPKPVRGQVRYTYRYYAFMTLPVTAQLVANVCFFVNGNSDIGMAFLVLGNLSFYFMMLAISAIWISVVTHSRIIAAAVKRAQLGNVDGRRDTATSRSAVSLHSRGDSKSTLKEIGAFAAFQENTALWKVVIKLIATGHAPNNSTLLLSDNLGSKLRTTVFRIWFFTSLIPGIPILIVTVVYCGQDRYTQAAAAIAIGWMNLVMSFFTLVVTCLIGYRLHQEFRRKSHGGVKSSEATVSVRVTLCTIAGVCIVLVCRAVEAVVAQIGESPISDTNFNLLTGICLDIIPIAMICLVIQWRVRKMLKREQLYTLPAWFSFGGVLLCACIAIIRALGKTPSFVMQGSMIAMYTGSFLAIAMELYRLRRFEASAWSLSRILWACLCLGSLSRIINFIVVQSPNFITFLSSQCGNFFHSAGKSITILFFYDVVAETRNSGSDTHSAGTVQKRQQIKYAIIGCNAVGAVVSLVVVCLKNQKAIFIQNVFTGIVYFGYGVAFIALNLPQSHESPARVWERTLPVGVRAVLQRIRIVAWACVVFLWLRTGVQILESLDAMCFVWSLECSFDQVVNKYSARGDQFEFFVEFALIEFVPTMLILTGLGEAMRVVRTMGCVERQGGEQLLSVIDQDYEDGGTTDDGYSEISDLASIYRMARFANTAGIDAVRLPGSTGPPGHRLSTHIERADSGSGDCE